MNKEKIKEIFKDIRVYKNKITDSKVMSIIRFVIKSILYIILQLLYHWKVAILLLSIIGLYYLNQNETLINNIFDFHIFNFYIVKVITLYDFHKNLQISQYVLEGAILVLLVLFLIFDFRLKDLKQNKMKKIKLLKDKGVELPYFKWRTRLWQNLKLKLWYWNMNGIGLSVFESDEFREGFQSSFNQTLVDREPVKTREDTIKLMVASPRYKVPKTILWKDEILNCTSKFTLGENLKGKVIIDINESPHILCAGQSGCGKSVLIDSLIYQAMYKGYVIRVCDPKKTEFNGWHNLTIKDTYLLQDNSISSQFSRTTDLKSAMEDLQFIEKELNTREIVFATENCRDIDKYNKKIIKSGTPLSRIIYIFDEFVEISTTKDKKVAEEIERILTEIATRGRSLGIHLILSAQRPDCKLLDGQIKTNMTNRISGRMPDISASETALGKGNYDAHNLIGKDEKGLFMTNDNQRFRGYFLDTEKLTEELHKEYDKQDTNNLGGTNNVEQ